MLLDKGNELCYGVPEVDQTRFMRLFFEAASWDGERINFITTVCYSDCVRLRSWDKIRKKIWGNGAWELIRLKSRGQSIITIFYGNVAPMIWRLAASKWRLYLGIMLVRSNNHESPSRFAGCKMVLDSSGNVGLPDNGSIFQMRKHKGRVLSNEYGESLKIE